MLKKTRYITIGGLAILGALKLYEALLTGEILSWFAVRRP